MSFGQLSNLYLPEVSVDKGSLAGRQSSPVGFAPGIGHENGVDLKAGAAEASRRGRKHLVKLKVNRSGRSE